jgi:DNA-directed RNA polymerase subunit RPC12/RpoP
MAKEWTCPNCGSDMRKVSDIVPPCYVCSNCGSSMEAEEQNFDNGEVCPNCHRLFDGSRECPNCGYDLGSDFD